jgi:hypothetical protein
VDSVNPHAVEFQMQIAVPAEELRGGGSFRDLQKICSRIEDAFTLAMSVCRVLEPRGWRLLAVRFEEEICITLVRRTTAELVRNDLAQLPRSILALTGDSVHICVSVGEHIFELAFADGGLRPLSPADSTWSAAPA